MLSFKPAFSLSSFTLTNRLFSYSLLYAIRVVSATCPRFFILIIKPAFSLSSFTLLKRLFSSSSLSAIRVVSFTYWSLLMFLLAILIPAYNSSSPTILLLYSVYTLNKQGDRRQPHCTPFSILNQSIVPYRVLTVAS